jgi:glycogen debranching enzyme
VCDHADWAGNLEVFRDLRPQVEGALGWIERHGDLDGDARIPEALEARPGEPGLEGLMDGVPAAQARPLAAPIALVEVRGYVIRALRRVARLLGPRRRGSLRR